MYVPPHRRNREAPSHGETQSLEGMYVAHMRQSRHTISVALEGYTEPNASSSLECPTDLTQQGDGTWLISLPIGGEDMGDDGLYQTLRWAAGLRKSGIYVILKFPSSLSKKNRANIHHHAQQAGLFSCSEGVGDARYIAVFGKKLREASMDDPMSPQLRDQADQIWGWIQYEGDELCGRYSRAEICEILRTNTLHRHPELGGLCEVHERRQRIEFEFLGACRDGHVGTIQNMLEEHSPGWLLWAGRSGSSSKKNLQRSNDRELPLHVACKHGRRDVVRVLVEAGADLKVCNSSGLNALDIAGQHRHDDIVAILTPK